MHEYTLDTGERGRVGSLCVIPAIAMTLALQGVLRAVGLNAPWFLDAPSPLLFYGLTFAAFDRYFWRASVKGIRLSAVPDISGSWAGTVRSSHDPDSLHRTVLQVRQRWSRMSVCLATQDSRSLSTVAGIFCEAGDGPRIAYVYKNSPSVLRPDTMRPHDGTATLRLSPNRRNLDGEYYTGHQRVTAGEMKLTFCGRDLLELDDAHKRLPANAKEPLP